MKIDRKMTLTIIDENGNPNAISSQGETLLEFLLNSQLSWPHSCGGMGTCGTCRVKVLNSEILPEPGEIEAEMVLDRQFSKSERLACQIPPMQGLKIKRDP